MGVIVGTDIPMFMGAMIVGPMGGWAIKAFDKKIDGKVRSGFEMLVNNFSARHYRYAMCHHRFLPDRPICESAVRRISGWS